MKKFAALLCLCLWGSAALAQTTFYWTNGVAAWGAASWSNELGDATLPQVGGSNDFTLVFGRNVAYTAQNDLAGSFVLNRLVFTNTGASSITNYLIGNTILFTNSSSGATPQLLQGGSSTVIISNSLNLASLTTLGGNGAGTLSLRGVVSGSGGILKTGTSTFTFITNQVDFTGGTTVKGGVLQWNVSSAGTTSRTGSFGTASITLDGGTFRTLNNTGTTFVVTNTFAITANGGTLGANSGSSTPSVRFAGPISLAGTGTLGQVIGGGGNAPGPAFDGTITLDQNSSGARVIVLAGGGNSGPTLYGSIVDGAGGAGNSLTIRTWDSGNGRAGTIAGSANTYAGDTTIAAPVSGSHAVIVDASSVLGTGNVRVNSGATLQFNADSNLHTSRSILTNNGSFIANYTPTVVTSHFVVAGAGTLIKNGAGTLVLSNGNSFNSLAINNGAIGLLNVSGGLGGLSNLNLAGGVLILGGTGSSWADFAANRSGGYGTGLNQWQITSANAGFAARGTKLVIDGAATTDSTFDRSFNLGDTNRVAGLYYADAAVEIARSINLTQTRTIRVANQGAGITGMTSNGVAHIISGNIGGTGALVLSSPALISRSQVAELVLAGATNNWTGAVTNSTLATGPGGFAIGSAQAVFLRFDNTALTANTSIPQGDGSTPFQIGGLQNNALAAGDAWGFGYGILFTGDADGQVYRLPSYSRIVLGANDDNDRPGTLGSQGKDATLASAQVLINRSVNSSQSLAVLVRDDGTFRLGQGAEEVVFVPTMGTNFNSLARVALDNTTNALTGIRNLWKTGTGTLVLQNVRYANLVGSTNPASAFATNTISQFVWNLGSATFGGYQGAVRETGLDSSNSLAFVKVNMQGGVLELGAADFTRSLGGNAGSLNMNGGGGGGFAAYGGTRAVQLNGGTAAVTWNSGSFVINGAPLLFGSYTANSLIDFQNGIVLGTAGNNTRDINVINNTATNGDYARISGVITGSVGQTLRKLGTGTLELTAANTYAGLTTNAAGTLLINGSLSAGGSAVVTLASATLGGSGTISRNVTIEEGGTLAPGNSIGKLTISNLTLADNALLAFELGSTNNSDQVVVTSTLNLGGLEFGQFSWSTNAGFGQGQYLLFDAQTLSGTLGTITNGQIAGFDAFLWTDTGSQNVMLTVIPEPSALMLVGAGLGLLVLVRRRR